MGFLFEKLYADMVTEDGTVCIAYMAWLNAWGVRSAFAGLEFYAPDGRREVMRARSPARRIDGDDGAFQLSFDVAGGPFVLRYHTIDRGFTPAIPPPSSAVRWSVKAARAEVTGRFEGDGARCSLHGIGYADWVELRRPARHLSLSAIEWGRVHRPGGTIVFNALRFSSNERWFFAARSLGDCVTEVRELEIDRSAPALRLSFAPALDDLHVEPIRVLHEGHPVDRARFPSRPERLLAKAVSGPAQECRWLGRARTGEGDDSKDGWALHEAVEFGASTGP